MLFLCHYEEGLVRGEGQGYAVVAVGFRTGLFYCLGIPDLCFCEWGAERQRLRDLMAAVVVDEIDVSSGH